MGNAVSSTGGVVKVLRDDGRTMEFPNDIAVAELLVVYPKCFVSQHQVQENGQVRRTVLGPDDVLRCGGVYLLQQQKAHGSAFRPSKIHVVGGIATGGDKTSGVHVQQHAKSAATVKAANPRRQVVKIVAEGSSVQITTNKGTARLNGPQISRLLHQAGASGKPLTKKKSEMRQGLQLETIPEEPKQQ